MAKDLVSSKSAANFWEAVIPIDLALLELLVDGKFHDTQSKKLVERYHDVRKLASAREFATVTDQIDFLETMAVAAKKKEIAKFLGDLRQKLE